MDSHGRSVISEGVAREHFVGAASEHYAAAYYLSQNYKVFWPAVPQGWTDFIVEKDGNFQRVQVKTGTWNKAHPPHSYLQVRTRFTNKYDAELATAYDILVVVADIGMWAIPTSDLGKSSNICLAGTRPGYKPVGMDYSPYKVSQ